MISLTRPIAGEGRTTYAGHRYHSGTADVRPCAGGAPVVTGPLPVGLPNGMPFVGMDPSDPSTYVRAWNPRGGMIAYLNFDGAQAQALTPTGGLQRGRQQRRRGYR